MQRRRISIFAAMLCFWLIPASSHAAAWTQPYGEVQFFENYNIYTTQYTNVERFSIGSSTVTVSEEERFVKMEFKPLLEVGATEDLTLGISPSLQELTAINGGGYHINWGLADVDFFLRQKLWTDGFSVISVQPLVKMFGIYDEAESPSLGQKQVDLELRGLYGFSFKENTRWHYVNIEGAYRKRMEEPSDEMKFEASLGYEFYPRIQIVPQISGTFAVNKSNNADSLATNSNDYDLVKAQLSFVKRYKENHAIQVGGYTHVYSRNTGDGVGFLLSYWYGL